MMQSAQPNHEVHTCGHSFKSLGDDHVIFFVPWKSLLNFTIQHCTFMIDRRKALQTFQSWVIKLSTALKYLFRQMIYSPVGHELISLHFCGLLFKLVPLLYDCDFIFSCGALVQFNVYAIFIHSLRFFAGSQTPGDSS